VIGVNDLKLCCQWLDELCFESGIALMKFQVRPVANESVFGND